MEFSVMAVSKDINFGNLLKGIKCCRDKVFVFSPYSLWDLGLSEDQYCQIIEAVVTNPNIYSVKISDRPFHYLAQNDDHYPERCSRAKWLKFFASEKGLNFLLAKKNKYLESIKEYLESVRRQRWDVHSYPLDLGTLLELGKDLRSLGFPAFSIFLNTYEYHMRILQLLRDHSDCDQSEYCERIKSDLSFLTCNPGEEFDVNVQTIEEALIGQKNQIEITWLLIKSFTICNWLENKIRSMPQLVDLYLDSDVSSDDFLIQKLLQTNKVKNLYQKFSDGKTKGVKSLSYPSAPVISTMGLLPITAKASLQSSVQPAPAKDQITYGRRRCERDINPQPQPAKSQLERSAPTTLQNPYTKVEQPTTTFARFGSFSISPPLQPTSSSPQPSAPPPLESIVEELPSLASFKKFSQDFSTKYGRSFRASAPKKEEGVVKPFCTYNHLTEANLREMDICALLSQLEYLGISESEVTKELEAKYPGLNFVCPLSASLIKEPVLASDGYNYEKLEFEKYVKSCGASPLLSPMTRQPMAKSIMPNEQLKRIIRGFLCSTILAKQAEFETNERASYPQIP